MTPLAVSLALTGGWSASRLHSLQSQSPYLPTYRVLRLCCVPCSPRTAPLLARYQALFARRARQGASLPYKAPQQPQT